MYTVRCRSARSFTYFNRSVGSFGAGGKVPSRGAR